MSQLRSGGDLGQEGWCCCGLAEQATSAVAVWCCAEAMTGQRGTIAGATAARGCSRMASGRGNRSVSCLLGGAAAWTFPCSPGAMAAEIQDG